MSDGEILKRFEYFLNILVQICIGFITIYMSWFCLRTGLAGITLHAWLVTIGFNFLMAEGIMCHYNNNILTLNYKRSTKTNIHWMLEALGGACGIAGTLVKCIPEGFKLYTTHGKLGFAAFILCCISLVLGLSALFSTTLKKIISPLFNKTFHTIVGISTFVVALVAQYYGYYYLSREIPWMDFITLLRCVTLISLVLACLGPLKSLYYKFCN